MSTLRPEPPPPAAHPAAPPRRMYRTSDGRMIAGVAGGVADHLGIDVWIVRSAFILLALTSLAGLVAYVALWALVPQAGEFDDPADSAVRAEKERPWRLGPLLAFGSLALGLVLLGQRFGLGLARGITIPVVVTGLGVAVLWRVADDTQRERWRAAAAGAASGSGRRAWLRVAVGVTFVLVGVAAVLAVNGGISAALNGLASLVIVALGVLAIAGPWLARLLREVRDERRERIRTQERADLAAHVHDSVLQTLTLVQRHADDPREVVRLARAEERALRGWLYDPERTTAGTFSPSLDRVAAEVEERHGGTVDVVVVGDAELDERLTPLLQAAREAIVNAAKYASADAPVSVYAEVGDREVAVFVRDRGPGFDPSTVPEDRHGVRESIIGRMERHGGRAEVSSGAGGTEIELVMPRETP